MSLDDCLRRCLNERDGRPPRPPRLDMLLALAGQTVRSDPTLMEWMIQNGLNPNRDGDALLTAALSAIPESGGELVGEETA